MTPALCTCGHPRHLHFGPEGHCCVTLQHLHDEPSRCSCSAFVLAVPAVIAPELTRSDLK